MYKKYFFIKKFIEKYIMYNTLIFDYPTKYYVKKYVSNKITRNYITPLIYRLVLNVFVFTIFKMSSILNHLPKYVQIIYYYRIYCN